jgi:hypothetical protein
LAIDINQFEIDRSAVTGILNQYKSDNSLGFRVRSIVNNNPYMANDMNAVMQMAQSDASDMEIYKNSGAIYGALTADTIMSQLKNYDPSVQRSIYSNLTPTQQQALTQQGYEKPKADKTDNDGFWGDAFGLITKPIGAILGGANKLPVLPGVVKGVFKGVEEVSNVPGWLYRTARNQSPLDIGIGLASAAVVIGGAIAAPATGGTSAGLGLSLAGMLEGLATARTVAVVGLEALAAANAAIAVKQVVTGNADDWWQSFSSAHDGDKFFLQSGIKDAQNILQDNKLANLAQKVALQYDEFSLLSIAKDVAEGKQSAVEVVTNIANELSDPGTNANKELVTTMTSLLQNPIFLDAVNVLTKSKISMGRDAAGLLGLDKGSNAYRFVSGSIDAASWFVFDPFMAASASYKSTQLLRKGIALTDEVNLLSRFTKIAKLPEIRRTYEIFADAINTNNKALMDRFVPWMKDVEEPFKAWMLRQGHETATADNFVEWVTGENHLKMIMQGKGIVHGSRDATYLKGINKYQLFVKENVTGQMADFLHGVRLEANIARLGEKAPEIIDKMMDSATINNLPDIEKLRLGNALNPKAFKAGQTFNKIPGAKGFSTMWEGMKLSVSARSAALNSATDIEKMVNMFTVSDVPKYVRDLWITAINGERGVGAKLAAIDSFYATMFNATGLTASEAGAQFADDILNKIKQTYELGANSADGLIPVTILQDSNTAVRVVVPELHEIAKAVEADTVLRHLARIPEHHTISALQTRFWKPSVLLKFGFIPRNAGEDFIGWVSRSGIGHITQEYAGRSIARGKLYGKLEEIKQSGRGLTVLEQKAVKEKYGVMAWMRPIEHRLARMGGDAAQYFLYDATASIRNVLERGMTLPDNVTRHPLYNWMLGAPNDLLDTYSLANAQIRARSMVQTLALGGKTSARRMMIGGVTPEIVKSSQQFVEKYAKVIMDKVGSSVTMSPYAGQLEKGTKVSISGAFDVVPASEAMPSQVLNNFERAIDDQGFNFIATQNQLHLAPEHAQHMPSDQLIPLLEDWKTLLPNIDANDPLFEIYMVLTENASEASGVLKTTNVDRWQSLVRKLDERGVDPGFVKRLKTQYLGTNVPTWEDFVSLNRQTNGSLTWGRTRYSNAQMKELVNFHNNHMSQIVDDSTRHFIKNNLLIDYVEQGKHLPVDEINKMGLDNPFGPFKIDKLENDRIIKEQALLMANEQTGAFSNFDTLKQFDAQDVGTRVQVIDFNTGATGPVNPSLLQGSLLDANGNIDITGISNALGIDVATATNTVRVNLEKLTEEIINSIIQREKLILHLDKFSQSENITNLHTYLDNVFNSSFNQRLPKLQQASIPISDINQINRAYPTIGKLKPAVKIQTATGSESLSLVKWDSRTYNLATDYLEAATASIGHEAMVDHLMQYYSNTTQSHMRLSLQTNKIMYEEVAGKAVEIAPGTDLNNLLHRRFFDDEIFSNKLDLGNRNYFKQTAFEPGPNSTVLHDLLQPALYDDYMAKAGFDLRQPVAGSNQQFFKKVGGQWEPDEIPIDYTRLKTLNESHFRRTPSDFMPDFVLQSAMEDIAKVSKWDNFLKKGFGVIGDSIDAIVRRPMAFHAFHQARMRNLGNVEWLFKNTPIDKELGKLLDDAIANKVFPVANVQKFDRLGDAGRFAGKVHGIEGSELWTNREAFGFLKGFKTSDADFQLFIDGLKANIPTARKDATKAKALIKFLEKEKDDLAILLPADYSTWDLLKVIDSTLGEGSVAAGRATRKGVTGSNLLQTGFQKNIRDLVEKEIGWDVIQRAGQAQQNAFTQSLDYAAEYAINDIMPFIDSHEMRSQFSEWMRGFMPFHYANENFLKRWALMVTKDGPLGAAVLARKLVLTQNGLRTMGVVRKDAQGKDYFVYPGSELLINVVEKLPWMGDLMPVAAMFQTPTDKMIPGFTTTNFGAPGLSPLIGISMKAFGSVMTELPIFNNEMIRAYDDLKTQVLGDQQQTRGYLDYIVPSSVKNTLEAVLDKGTGAERISSATMSAIAHLEATGNGLREGATAAEADEFVRTVRNHARIIVVSQALAGWFTPGPASTLQTTNDQSSISWLTDGKIDDAQALLSQDYYSLVTSLGIEAGTQKYLELYTANTVHDIINPSAYTVSKTETSGKAVLPGTEEGLDFYLTNKSTIDQYPTAGAWLLPQADSKDDRTKHAYDSELINGFRNMKTPEKFLNEVKFKEASHDYFKAKNGYEEKIIQLDLRGDYSLANQYSAEWDRQSLLFKSAHPIFTQYLEAGDARQRRDQILSELRYALDDPLFPKAKHFEGMKTMIDTFDLFIMQKRRLSLSGSGINNIMKKDLQDNFLMWSKDFINNNPGVETFWNTVIQPEIGL